MRPDRWYKTPLVARKLLSFADVAAPADPEHTGATHMSWVFAGVRKSVASKYSEDDDTALRSRKPGPSSKELQEKYGKASEEMEGGRESDTDSGEDVERKREAPQTPNSPSKKFTNLSYKQLTKGIVNYKFRWNKARMPRKAGVYYHPDGSEYDNRMRWYSIDPYGNFRKNWDLAQAIILVFVSITVPFRVGLKQPAEGPSYWVELLIDLYFWFDIAFNFCTGYEAEEEEGVIVYHPKLIRAHYFKTWFTIDLLACLPVDLALRATEGTLKCSMEVDGCDIREEDGTGQLFKLFKLLKLLKYIMWVRHRDGLTRSHLSLLL